MTVREIQKILKDNGFEFQRQKGSHQIWSNGKNVKVLPVIHLNKMLARRLVREIESGI